jgi:hypothetical protein
MQKTEDHFGTTVHITSARASFVGIYGILYGVMLISQETSQI